MIRKRHTQEGECGWQGKVAWAYFVERVLGLKEEQLDSGTVTQVRNAFDEESTANKQ